MPAHKKHPSTRKRRNRASTATTLTLAPPPADDDVVDWTKFTVPALRLELGQRDLDTSGLKPALVARLVADDEDPGHPELPDRPDQFIEGELIALDWHPQVVAWWADVWSSPMSNEWHRDTDVHNVLLAAVHLDDFWKATDPVMRQKADAAFKKTITPLGLTPYDRRRLEWTIATAGEATERRQRRRGATPIGDGAGSRPPKRIDPRAKLAGAAT